MSERKIRPVLDNKDKQKTYTKNMAKYKIAMVEEFYYEALLIDYAMIEDRLRSFLYHIGLFKDRQSHKVDNKQIVPPIKQIVSQYKSNEENDSLNVNSISGKMKIIRCTLQWAINTAGVEDNKYLIVLKDQYEGTLDIGAILETLNDITEWCAYRNEVIHALLNKNTNSLMNELSQRAAQGMELARFMDAQVRSIKKGHVIRRKINLKTE